MLPRLSLPVTAVKTINRLVLKALANNILAVRWFFLLAVLLTLARAPPARAPPARAPPARAPPPRAPPPRAPPARALQAYLCHG